MPKRTCLDLTGQKFCHLQVIHSNGTVGNSRASLCKCDCGKEKLIVSSLLSRGRVKTCGCGMRPDLVGKRFGKLLVVGHPSPIRTQSLCSCDCGEIITTFSQKLTAGQIASCGCLKRVRKKSTTIENLTGYKFGQWTVLGPSDARGSRNRYLWKCQCSCGTIVHKSGGSIRCHDHEKCSACANNGKREIVGELTNRYWKRVVDSARARYIPFSISRKFAWGLFLNQDRKCALTGIVLVFAKSYEGEAAKIQTASLDRIDSSKAYTEDNVQWVHRVVNRLKNNMSDPELILWCQAVADYSRKSL